MKRVLAYVSGALSAASSRRRRLSLASSPSSASCASVRASCSIHSRSSTPSHTASVGVASSPERRLSAADLPIPARRYDMSAPPASPSTDPTRARVVHEGGGGNHPATQTAQRLALDANAGLSDGPFPLPPAGSAEADVPPPSLTDLEARIFEVLLAVVREKNLGLTLRVAGGWVRDKLLLANAATAAAAAAAAGSAATTAATEASGAFRRRIVTERGSEVTAGPASASTMSDIRAVSANEPSVSVRPLRSVEAQQAETDFSVDIDIALDKMMGEDFAMHVRDWLVAHDYPSSSPGVIPSNPDQSKHLATARMKVLGVWVDLVNLRTETYAQSTSRIPEVSIGTPYEDAMRRDLTINALFYNINTGRVEDYTRRGVSDLRARIVRTPLPPLTTLLDDPLRALRAIRFASRFNFSFNHDLYAACAAPEVHAALGAKVSRERISSEIDSILSSASPIHALGLLTELGLFPIVFRVPAVSDDAAYVGDGRPPSDFPRAALGCLINLDRLCAARRNALSTARRERAVAAGMASAATVTTGADGLTGNDDGKECAVDSRIARYAALLAPVAPVCVLFAESGRKARPSPLAQYILRTELRMSARDVAAVVSIHRSSLDFKALVRRSGFLEKQCTSVGDVAIDNRQASNVGDSTTLAEPDRLTVGRILRSIGPLWRVSLYTALITELSPAVAAETYARGITCIADCIVAESAATVAAYCAFEERVDSMGLDKVWDLKPVVDGRDLTRLLPQLPRGPLIGKLMTSQVEYQIENPTATREDVKAWILDVYKQYR